MIVGCRDWGSCDGYRGWRDCRGGGIVRIVGVVGVREFGGF